jgi:hypothetical protein
VSVTVHDPDGMARGTTLNGVMDSLAELAAGSVADALKAADPQHRVVQVTRYMPRRPNAPAIWHERRPGRNAAVDTAHDRAEVYVAVILALNHGEQDLEAIALERAIDAALDVYRQAVAQRGALNNVHRADVTNLEPPTPTVINDVPLLTSGIVLRLRIDARRPPRA